jgi:hypothetical protein
MFYLNVENLVDCGLIIDDKIYLKSANLSSKSILERALYINLNNKLIITNNYARKGHNFNPYREYLPNY